MYMYKNSILKTSFVERQICISLIKFICRLIEKLITTNKYSRSMQASVLLSYDVD